MEQNSTMLEYDRVLQKKRTSHKLSGFEAGALNPKLFKFQEFIVRRALGAGKYAIFADCGLGKTFMQLEWAFRVSEKENKPVLILAPLAVVEQTIEQGEFFGIPCKNYDGSNFPIQIINYDQLENVDTDIFSGVALDEASIIKHHEGVYRNLIIDKFKNTPYKLACTATPSPNDPMEIGNYAEFLDVMGRNQMLAMYFVHDGGETSKWRLKGHATKSFYQFVGSWAIMLSKPEDIGFHMDGYDLPPLNLIDQQIITPQRDNGQLFNDTAISATTFNQELRLTKIERMEQVAEIVNSKPDENILIWINQNEEGQYLKSLIPDAVEISGSDSLDRKRFVSLWFGNQKNECTCEIKKKNQNIGSVTTKKTKNLSENPPEKDLKIKENLIQNGEKEKTNTLKNTTNKIKTSSISEHQKKLRIETEDVESCTQPMKSIESEQKDRQENLQGEIQTLELKTPCVKITELQSNNTTAFLSNKKEDAQYVEANQHLKQQSKDFMSITATQQEGSEDCYVQTAIRGLENSMIQKYCSNAQLCTCCGKHKRKVMIGKLKMLSFGLNYQSCHNQIFASLDFSFEALYQGIRRSYRFGQEHPVNIYLITTDTMTNVIESINRKQKQFEIMQHEMAEAVNAHLNNSTLSSVEYDTESERTEWYDIRRGDCVRLIQDLPDESIGLSVFSPPFAELYTYSSHLEDMGNSKDYKEFMEQFGFLVRELYRVLKSGRNIAVHCMDLPIQKGREGFIGLRDFSGMLLRLFEDSGFIYHSRVTIWKDPVVEMQRTKALGLLHKQIKKDSTMSRVGIPDYVLIFRKDGERNDPVTNTNLPVDLWQKYASPIWMDIDYGDTLQGKSARDEKDEKHIAPLQLQTIERLIHLYSNPGDTVLTPFMGIGSEVYQAVKMNRKGIGFELKESYFEQAKNNCRAAVNAKSQLTIF